MIGVGALFIYAAVVVFGVMAWARRDDSLRKGLTRAIEQGVVVLPRMVFALIAAGFVVKLIPTDIIVRYLGNEAGFTGVLIGSVTGLLVPSGPVVAFAIAAAFAGEGASLPALIAFVTAWSVFATHRVFIFELPLLGAQFVRLRMLAVIPLPLIAGLIAMFTTRP